jgi:hypothetical protein
VDRIRHGARAAVTRFSLAAISLRQLRSFARWFAVLTIAIVCTAHVGSPDAWFNGAVGPYRALIHVQAPPVVPGIAIIRIKPEAQVTLVNAFVNKYDAKVGAPPPDDAKPVESEPGWYRTQLWVMDPGSNSVTVSIEGAAGKGTVVIPLVAVAGRRLAFDGVLSVLLAIAGLVLVAGLVTIIGASVRESVLTPGGEPDNIRRKRARFAMFRGAIVIALVLSGLGAWWRAEDRVFTQNLFKPLTVATHIDSLDDGTRRLVFSITDSAWTQRHVPQRARPRGGSEFASLVEDHGKLMHLFVVGESGSSFAHLHPTTGDSVTFFAALPPLSGGRQRIYADVLHATGLTQTLVSTIDEPAHDFPASATAQSSGDDGWIVGATPSSADTVTLDDGSVLTWTGAQSRHVVGQEANLSFTVKAPPGSDVPLEPYLGMAGHAVVVRADGAVFIHLHPLGTVSVAAQALLTNAGSAATADHNSAHAMTRGSVDTLHFPYAFPSAGDYTVWLQVKRNGRVLTGAFRVHVLAS